MWARELITIVKIYKSMREKGEVSYERAILRCALHVANLVLISFFCSFTFLSDRINENDERK